MKKLLALALTLSLALFASAALAVDLNWSDVEAQVSEIDASFVAVEQVGVKIWVPSVLQAQELTAEDIEDDCIAYYETADGTAAFEIDYFDAEGQSLQEYAAAIAEEGATSIEDVVINGLSGISYDYQDDDESVIAFETEAGKIIEFAFAPMSDEGFAAIAYMMVSSIQAM